MRKSMVIAGLVLLAFCLVCRFVTPVSDFYAASCYPFISLVLSRVGSIVPFSLEEIVVLGFAAALILILVKALRKKEGFLPWLKKTAVAVMWLYVWFYMGWGNNYYRTGLYERNGIARVRYESESFQLFLEDFARELNGAAALAESYDREELEQEIRAFYSRKVTPYGYTQLRPWQGAKLPLLNPLYSAVLVHGFMGPFFCEPQVNRDLLSYEYPFTLAHEMAHLAGVTSEAEANWWGFACCRESANACVRYSGYLSILPYVLSNAYSLLPEETYFAWTATLSGRVIQDFTESREYWKEKKVDWIEKAQKGFYNLYLRSNGVSAGVKDYYGVVSIIMTMEANAQ